MNQHSQIHLQFQVQLTLSQGMVIPIGALLPLAQYSLARSTQARFIGLFEVVY